MKLKEGPVKFFRMNAFRIKGGYVLRENIKYEYAKICVAI